MFSFMVLFLYYIFMFGHRKKVISRIFQHYGKEEECILSPEVWGRSVSQVAKQQVTVLSLLRARVSGVHEQVKREKLKLGLEKRLRPRASSSLFVFQCYCSVVSRCLKGPQRLKPWLSSSVGEQVSNFISWNEVCVCAGAKIQEKMRPFQRQSFWVDEKPTFRPEF